MGQTGSKTPGVRVNVSKTSTSNVKEVGGKIKLNKWVTEPTSSSGLKTVLNKIKNNNYYIKQLNYLEKIMNKHKNNNREILFIRHCYSTANLLKIKRKDRGLDDKGINSRINKGWHRHMDIPYCTAGGEYASEIVGKKLKDILPDRVDNYKFLCSPLPRAMLTAAIIAENIAKHNETIINIQIHQEIMENPQLSNRVMKKMRYTSLSDGSAANTVTLRDVIHNCQILESEFNHVKFLIDSDILGRSWSIDKPLKKFFNKVIIQPKDSVNKFKRKFENEISRLIVISHHQFMKKFVKSYGYIRMLPSGTHENFVEANGNKQYCPWDNTCEKANIVQNTNILRCELTDKLEDMEKAHLFELSEPRLTERNIEYIYGKVGSGNLSLKKNNIDSSTHPGGRSKKLKYKNKTKISDNVEYNQVVNGSIKYLKLKNNKNSKSKNSRNKIKKHRLDTGSKNTLLKQNKNSKTRVIHKSKRGKLFVYRISKNGVRYKQYIHSK